MAERKRIAEIDPRHLSRRLGREGVILATPPFVYRLHAQEADRLAEAVSIAYAGHELLGEDAFVDFDLVIRPVTGIRRWIKPLIEIEFDGARPFAPLPRAQVFPLLEWAMNWCVTTSAHHYLMAHSAVLAQGERALILPAPPGSGKSTLAAALMLAGWRLLSDELALLDPGSGALHPFVRPVSLKNASIEIVCRRFREAVFTPPVRDTIKGTVAHLRPTLVSVAEGCRPAFPRWLVFPHYVAGTSWTLTPLLRPQAVLELAKNAFNLPVLGAAGFTALSELVRRCDCYQLEYGDLDQALEGFSALAEQTE